MSTFLPPKPNSLFISFTKLLMPLLLRNLQLSVKPTADCLINLRSLDAVHTVLLFNHADRLDPVAVFELSRQSGQEFLYLAAREVFDSPWQLQAWCMQHCGAYSVIRGEPEDAESREMTVSLIVRGDRKLVMFPEGDVTGRDDQIEQLKEDGLRNIFEAQGRLLQYQPGASVMLLPVAMYYEVQDDAIEKLLDSLGILESRLGIRRLSFSLESRMMRLLAAFLEQVELLYGLDSGANNPPDRRLQNVVRHVSESVARYNNLDIDRDVSEDVLLYSVRGHLQRLLQSGTNEDSSGFEAALSRTASQRAKTCMNDLDRMQQLLILSTTLQQEPFTLEFAWRVIDRLEDLILGRTLPKGHRVVWVDSARPVDLQGLWPVFERDSHRALRMVDRLVRTALMDKLHQLKETRQSALLRDR